MPTPLATDGDWSAYLDEETTGYSEFCVGLCDDVIYVAHLLQAATFCPNCAALKYDAVAQN